MLKMFLIKAIGIGVALLGAYIIADGIGSIFEQENQPFFWWQFVRVLRSVIGGVLIGLGAILISLD